MPFRVPEEARPAALFALPKAPTFSPPKPAVADERAPHSGGYLVEEAPTRRRIGATPVDGCGKCGEVDGPLSRDQVAALRVEQGGGPEGGGGREVLIALLDAGTLSERARPGSGGKKAEREGYR